MRVIFAHLPPARLALHDTGRQRHSWSKITQICLTYYSATNTCHTSQQLY